MLKLKNLPNGLSILRLLLCVGMVFSAMLGKAFGFITMTMFVIAGISDMVDGPLARRIKGGRSELGASLDSIGDLVMIIVSIIVFIPAMNWWSFIAMLYIIAISFKVIIPSLIAVVKYKEFISLHTYTFKVLVGFLFSIPILFFIFQELEISARPFLNVYALIIGIAACLFIVEEIIIILATNRPCRDIKSIFSVKRFNAYDGGEKIGTINARSANQGEPDK